MADFSGFPQRMQFTPIPNLFFGVILPKMDDMAELKTTLCVLAALYQKRGYPRFVSRQELMTNTPLMQSLGKLGENPAEVLARALELAVRRGTLLHLAVVREGQDDDIYLLNTDKEREVIERIKSGEIKMPGLGKAGEPPPPAEKPPDIFALYEANIGLLTPMIAEELKEAEKTYPEEWLREAVKEAVSQNKRKWSYISAILERWASEGRDSGTHRRHPKEEDPDKYIKGRYGHMVRRR